MKNIKVVHWVLGLILLAGVVFVLVSLIVPNTQGDDITTSASIQNVTPSIDSVYISDDQYGMADDYSGGTITGLNSGSTKTVHVNGVVSDDNGFDDIFQVSVVLFRTTKTSSCSADKNDCYSGNTSASCSLNTAYGDSIQAQYDCEFALEYFIDGTDSNSANSGDEWTVEVIVEDDDAETDTDTTVTKDIETLLSLNIPATIDFGTLALGASTTDANNVEMSITQYGNVNADVEVSGASLTCDSSDGVIPLGNIEWSLSDVGYGSQNDLTGSAVDTNFGIATRTDEASPLIKKLYWEILIPTTGVEGDCSGTTVVTAKIAD
jgi:hypothetical protein